MSRREPFIQIGSPLSHIMEYVYLILGSLVIALSFNIFLVPNQVASGGVSGISIIVKELFGVTPALTQWALNIPLFFAGLWLLGGKFGIKTLVGSAVLPLLVLVTSGLPSLTDNTLLAAIYGGIGVGAGLGLVFRGRASTGGLDLAAQILHKYTGLRLGLCVALLDGTVILVAGLAISPEKALYALIGLYVTIKTIDVVQMGFGYSKVAFIISDQTDRLSEVILKDLDRGLTKLTAQGGFTNTDRPVLMVVVGQTEVTKLKTLVQSVDPSAFIIISDTTEVLGKGFKVQGT
ncbi:YitT family protein [Paenibacillus gansuensis]|uniref:YitT family protein n=1 Tax=Paenibacillus gansuensis TaxID=306542 RepID=A0ABW5PL63_9BACL